MEHLLEEQNWKRLHVVAECTFVVTRDQTENRGGTRPDNEGQCQIPGMVDNPARKKDDGEKKDERMYGESFKPGSHRDSLRQRTRHLRGRRKRGGEEDVGGWRTPAHHRAVENFSQTFRDATAIVRREKPAKETIARRKRVVRTKLRPSGKWNAGELEKFKCARLWRRLRKSPLFSHAPREAASRFRFSLPLLPPRRRILRPFYHASECRQSAAPTAKSNILNLL